MRMSAGASKLVVTVLCWTLVTITAEVLQRKICPYVLDYKPSSECTIPNHLCTDDAECENGLRCCPQEVECGLKCSIAMPPRGCPIPIDLAFVLDSSGSIARKSWIKLKKFVNAIIDNFDISEKGTHVGIVMYSSGASVQMHFDKHKGALRNNVNAKRVVNDLRLERGLTFIDKGLTVANEELFIEEKGMRLNRKKVCFVITDGIQTKTRGPYTPLGIASEPLKKKGVAIYAMGIGTNLEVEELMAVATGPDYVYTAQSFDALQPEVEVISKAQCQACGSRVDVIFGIPDASTLGHQFEDIKKFFEKMTSLFQVSAENTHIGIIIYSDNANMIIKLDQTYRASELTKAIKNLRPEGNSLNVESALQVAADNGFTIFGGVRQTAPKTMIIFVPRDIIQKPSLAAAATKLKGMGVRLIMMGLTGKMDPSLSAVASQPKLRYFISAVDFDALGVAAYEAADTVCKARYAKCQAEIHQPAVCPSNAVDSCDVDKDCDNKDDACCPNNCGRICQIRVQNCFVTMDVGIAVDSSSDITDEEFAEMKSFINHFIHSFSDSENAIRFGLMQYDEQATTLTNLKPFTNEVKMKSMVSNMRKSTNQKKRVDIALKAMKKDLFSLEGGMRQGHPRYAIFLTSGQSSEESEDLAKASEDLRKIGVTIVAVGIGITVEKPFLDSLATEPSLSFEPSGELIGLWPNLKYKICSAKPGSCPVPAQEVCSGKPKIGSEQIPCGKTAGYQDRMDKENDWDCPGEQKCCLDPTGCVYLCQHPPRTCSGQYDLALLLESTDDIGHHGFEKVKQFAIELVDAFTIWQAASRVAVITYGSRMRVNFLFSSFARGSLNKQVITNAIKDLQLIGGAEASTGEALQAALDDLYTRRGGSRENANKSLVIISQGKFKDSAKAINIASELRKQSVDIFAVPIGPNPDIKKLVKVVNKPVEKNIFMTTSTVALTPNLRALTKTICQGAEKIKICKSPMDVIFGIPSAKSLGSSLKGAEDVFKSILSLLRVNNMQIHVGLETYSDTADINVNLDSSYNKNNITEYINRLKSLGKKVDVGQAFEIASAAGFSIFSGVRQTSPKAFILFVPKGATLSGASVREAATNLKGLGVRLFVIGLKSAIDTSVIKALVSQPSQKFIYTADSYGELAALASEIVESLCKGRYGKCPISTPIATCPEKPTTQCLLDKDCAKTEYQCCEDQCGSSACTKGLQNCFVTMDVAIAIDSSAAISDADFNQIKSFTAHLIHSLAVAENAIRFGLMQYGLTAKALVSFLRYTTETKLKSIVEKLQKFSDSSRRVDVALSTMEKKLFSVAGGMRQGHPKFAIFITAGETSADSEDLTKASKGLRKLGVNIIAVGITSTVGRGFLNTLSTKRQFSFPLASSVELQSLWPQFATGMCNEKPGKCPVFSKKACRTNPVISPDQVPCGDSVGKKGRTAKENDWDCPGERKCCLDTTGCLYLCQHPPNICRGQFDLALVLEASNDAGPYGFAKIKDLASSLVDSFLISASGTRVAVVTYADTNAIVNIRFNTMTGRTLTSQAVKDSIADILIAGDTGSSPSQALQVVLDEVFTKRGGSRENANKSLVIISHGRFHNNIKDISLANKIRQKSVDIFAVAIGPNVDVPTLSKVVSRPINKNIFMATSYNALRPNLRALTETICIGAQKVITCDQPLDVVFGIPVSEILGNSFVSIKDVFKSILHLLRVNKMQVHVGIEPYSENAHFPVHIDNSYNRESISNYITTLGTSSYGINLADAFRVAADNAFTIYGGVRQTSPKAFIILVPGLPPDLDNSIGEAVRKLKGLGVKVFVIGLENVVNAPNINILASQPTNKYLYAAKSYDALVLEANKIVNVLCKGRYGRCKPPTPPPPGVSCPSKPSSNCVVDKQCRSAEHMCCADECGATKCTQGIKNCFVPSEITFALETSEHTTKQGFQDMKEVVIGIARFLANSENNLHIGIMTYASKPSAVTRGFININSEEELTKHLDTITKTTDASARVDLVFQAAKREFFSPKGGMRHGHPKYLILLASSSNVAQASSDLEKAGINVIPIGMSDTVNETFLETISSDDWFMMESSIEKLVLDVTSKLCHEKPGKCPAVSTVIPGTCTPETIVPDGLIPCGRSVGRGSQSTSQNDWDCPGESKCCLEPTNGCHYVCVPPPLVCNKKKDLLFVVESNDRNGPTAFKRIKKLTKQIVKAFSISQSGTHVGFMTVTRQPRINFRFDSFRGSLTKNKILDRIDRARFTAGFSAPIHMGLEVAENKFFGTWESARESVNKTIVLFTSSRYSEPHKAIEISQRLKDQLIDIFAVPIGADPDIENIERTVSAESDNNIFRISSTAALKPQLRAMVNTICDGGKKLTPLPGPTRFVCVLCKEFNWVPCVELFLS